MQLIILIYTLQAQHVLGIAMPKTCWACKLHLVGFSFFSFHNDARSNKHQIDKYTKNEYTKSKFCTNMALFTSKATLVAKSVINVCRSSCEIPVIFLLFVNLLAPELFFFNFNTPVYKMWIIQEPNTLELWNKLHFEENKTESIYHV